MLIQSQKSLDEAIAAVKDSQFIAIDTEFLRTKTYYPLLCLIQISNGKVHFIIDMLADLDFARLTELLLNEKLVKVIHSARQDLEVLFNKFGVLPKNIFDTQVGMQFLGFQDPPSYESMINHYLSQKIDKKLQFSNWQKRPLEEAQLTYALYDVIHLSRVYPLIYNDIKALDRLDWLKEECWKMEKQDSFIPNLEMLLNRCANFLDKEIEFLHCLRLLAAREKIAEAADKERSRVISNELLIQIAKGKTPLEKAAHIGVDIDLVENKKILEAERLIVANVIANKRIRTPKRNANYELLKAKLIEVANKERISSTLIANSEDILKLANGSNKTKLNSGWRYEFIGKKLIDLIQTEAGK
jgi:ribonuclease D